MQKLLFMTLLLITSSAINAQVSFKTEYIGKSNHKDENNIRTGGRGDAMIYSASINLPLSYEIREDDRMKAWAISLNSSYTSMGNNEAMKRLSPDKIFNNRVGLLHIRPAWERWSWIATIGAGTYSPHTRIGKTKFDEVLFDGALLFVWHLRKNLDLGFGMAFNSSFGYPMGFPAFYLKWNTSGKFYMDVQMMTGATITGGFHLNDHFSLALVADMNGSLALEKVGGRKCMFSHAYMTTSLQPEFKLGKHISIPIRVGVSVDRTAYYEERTLKAFFKAYKREYDPHFTPSLYLSAGVNISF